MDNEKIKMIEMLTIPVIKDLLIILYNKYKICDEEKIIELDEYKSELGSIKVSYNKENETKCVYIILKICDKNHDLGTEINKIKPYVTEDQWKQILTYLSTTVFILRTIYSSIYEKLNCTSDAYKNLSVDMQNTTIYLDGVDERIGIFFEECDS